MLDYNGLVSGRSWRSVLSQAPKAVAYSHQDPDRICRKVPPPPRLFRCGLFGDFLFHPRGIPISYLEKSKWGSKMQRALASPKRISLVRPLILVPRLVALL